MRKDIQLAASLGCLAVILGVVALIFEGRAPTLPACGNKWGYVLKDSYSCQRGPDANWAIAFGIGFGIVGLAALRAALNARRARV